MLCVCSEGMTDDRCQWQIKGGRSFAERETSANVVKRESAARGGATVTVLTERKRHNTPVSGKYETINKHEIINKQSGH